MENKQPTDVKSAALITKLMALVCDVAAMDVIFHETEMFSPQEDEALDEWSHARDALLDFIEDHRYEIGEILA